MRPFRVTDLVWSWSGDLKISDTGDLAGTPGGSIDSFVQEVQTRVGSELGDWALHPSLGASLIDLVGEPNNRTIAEEGKERIRDCLVRDGFCNVDLINIRYTPVSQTHLLYNLKIRLPGLGTDEVLSLSLIFDTSEYDVVFV